MKFLPVLALPALLALCSGAYGVSGDEEEEPAPVPNPAVQIPLSSFEAIQPAPPAGQIPGDAATPPPPLRLQIDPSLSPVAPVTPPPPLTPAPPRQPPPSGGQ